MRTFFVGPEVRVPHFAEWSELTAPIQELRDRRAAELKRVRSALGSAVRHYRKRFGITGFGLVKGRGLT